MNPPTPQTLAKHGLTAEQWQQLWDAQSGRCAICNKPPRTRLVIDHDHKSSLVRGLLCPLCNGKLGKVRDDASWCENAADYLTCPVATYTLKEQATSRAHKKPRRRRQK